MAQPPRAYMWVIHAIDGITIRMGMLLALLMIPLILANVYEVVMRYAFNAPTMWALDVTIMAYAPLFMLGACYTLQRGAHVRTDIFWEKFSDRTKSVIDSIVFLVFFLPSMVILFNISFDSFLYYWSINERSSLSIWQPPVWPLRGVIPLTAAMLFLQGISELMKSLWAVRTGEMLRARIKVEI